LHPVALTPRADTCSTADEDARLAAVLKQVKEDLATASAHGLGYGLLRHLNPDTAPELAALPSPRLLFNYLGRFDAATEADWA
ncbi:hypothetical protein ACSNOK_35540, partial [Streptomyces sp. URMC 126]|uniref:hypothetical protein n=1 Tax=Streptomyces sp. URMC 126 TaxID=3423401 RepID=UPI003F1A3971